LATVVAIFAVCSIFLRYADILRAALSSPALVDPPLTLPSNQETISIHTSDVASLANADSTSATLPLVYTSEAASLANADSTSTTLPLDEVFETVVPSSLASATAEVGEENDVFEEETFDEFEEVFEGLDEETLADNWSPDGLNGWTYDSLETQVITVTTTKTSTVTATATVTVTSTVIYMPHRRPAAKRVA
jgi:hypothetical protein